MDRGDLSGRGDHRHHRRAARVRRGRSRLPARRLPRTVRPRRSTPNFTLGRQLTAVILIDVEDGRSSTGFPAAASRPGEGRSTTWTTARPSRKASVTSTAPRSTSVMTTSRKWSGTGLSSTRKDRAAGRLPRSGSAEQGRGRRRSRPGQREDPQHPGFNVSLEEGRRFTARDHPQDGRSDRR